MKNEMIAALLQFAVAFGIPAALAFLRGINKPDITIDDAIAALDAAATKTAENYLEEARARLAAPIGGSPATAAETAHAGAPAP